MPDAVLTPPASNNPPLVEQARMSIDEQLAALEPRKAELLGALERAKCDDADSAGKCADLIKQLKKLATKADAIRKDVKDPYADATKAIDAAAKNFSAALLEAETRVRAMLAAFDRREREREDRERREREATERAERERVEAEQRRAAEAAKAAGAEVPTPIVPEPQAEPEPARRETPKPVAAGDYGASAHRRKVTVLEVEDPYALPEQVLKAPEVIEAIIRVCRRLRTANPDFEIHGLIVREETAVMVR